MKLTTILFDLDGTLLPMDQEKFIKSYFSRLAVALAKHGYESKPLYTGIWAGMDAMIHNDGSATNEEVFWKRFCGLFGEQARKDEPIFKQFYHTDFQMVAQDCGFAPAAREVISLCKSLGLRIVLATNPLFPAIATHSRIRWAGLEPDDFELITTYENARFCKPNPDYYKAILQSLHLDAQECMMVGNDVGEDMIAGELGMRVFLLTDCLINAKGMDLHPYPHGSFPELLAFIRSQA